MSSTTITLAVSASYGYGRKQYVARITGRAAKVTFARDFVGQKYGKRQESTSYDTDEVGLYELCSIDRKGQKEQRYRLILPAPGAAACEGVAGDAEEEGRVDEGAALRETAAGLVVVRASKEEAMAIAKRLDKGEQLVEIVRIVDLAQNQIEILTAAQAKKAAAAATVDEAVSACLAVLGALPEREAKRVVAELRKRTVPASSSARGASDDAIREALAAVDSAEDSVVRVTLSEANVESRDAARLVVTEARARLRDLTWSRRREGETVEQCYGRVVAEVLS